MVVGKGSVEEIEDSGEFIRECRGSVEFNIEVGWNVIE